jgi:crotonobetainyl-CoA:carnitine CoA-transferase CaiB-like acyl-CoA transferase
MAEHEIPSGPINDYAQVFEHPQVQHRGLRVEMPPDTQAPAASATVSGSVVSSVSTIASPLRLSRTPVTYRHAPPHLGAHTFEVLSDWIGLDAAQLEALRLDGVIE